MPVFIQNSLDGFYWGLATLSCSCREYSGSLCLPKTSGGLPDSFVLLLTAELVPWIWLEDDLQPELMTDRFCRSPGHIWGVYYCHCARATYTDEYFRLLAQWCYFALQVPHRVTHAFWWAWLQTRGKLAIIFALRRETTLWCRDLLNNTRGSSFFPCCASSPSPSLSCWCSLCRTRPSHWCRVWRTRSPNTAACLCWPLLRAPCAPRWSSQVSTCSFLLSCPLLGRVVIFVPHLSLLHPIVLGFFSLSSNITTRAVPCYGDRRLL